MAAPASGDKGYRQLCCDELREAFHTTFINPMRGQPEWLAYGTDFESVSSGAPEIRFWPVRYCPFCGHRLPDDGRRMPPQQPDEPARSDRLAPGGPTGTD